MTTYKIIVAGSRDFSDYELLRKKCDECISYLKTVHEMTIPIEIVSGGCTRGADKLGERFAKERGLSLKRFPAKWHRYNKQAGVLRNAEMAEYADALIAFWDGESKGTANMIDNAMHKGLKTFIIRTNKPS